MMDEQLFIGVMSGTSADGVDAALLRIRDANAPQSAELLEHAFVAFPDALHRELARPLDLSLKRLTELHFLLPNYYAQAVKQLSGWPHARAIGMHGQTITHQVSGEGTAPRATLQIGAPAVLATACQLPVVADLRSVDVALAGQGAPIAPIAHWFFERGDARPCAVVNLGGICNVTFVTESLTGVVGYDVGPGMMLSDRFAKETSDGVLTYDRDGVLSGGGQRIQKLFDAVLAHPFIARPAPKSAGREDFGTAFYNTLRPLLSAPNVPADVAFTLHEATASALGRAVKHHQSQLQNGAIQRLTLSGGGAKNPTLAALIRREVAPLEVAVAASGLLAPERLEAAAMALIAARSIRQFASALPSVTGSDYGAVLGSLTSPTVSSRRVPNVRRDRVLGQPEKIRASARAILAQMLRRRETAGIVVCAHMHARPLFSLTAGHAVRYEQRSDEGTPDVLARSSSKRITQDSVFDVASLTKVLATTTLIGRRLHEGRIALHAQAKHWLPELESSPWRETTLRELLTHTSGLPAYLPFFLDGTGREEIVTRIARLSPAAPRGNRLYSDLGYMLLAILLERMSATPLDVQFAREVAEPVGAHSLRYRPEPNDSNLVATSHRSGFERRMTSEMGFGLDFAGKRPGLGDGFKWREQTLRGEVDDNNCHHVMKGVSGHAGLFGTAEDVCRVLDLYACGAARLGTSAPVGDETLLSLTAHDATGMTPGWERATDLGDAKELGFDPKEAGMLMQRGFTGCLAVALPSYGVSVAVLTNRTHTRVRGELVNLRSRYAQITRALAPLWMTR